MRSMLKWSKPDIKTLIGAAGFGRDRCLGSDTTVANIFLLSGKYDIKTAVDDGVLFRYYNGSTPNRHGYGFPLYSDPRSFEFIFDTLFEDAKLRGIPLGFCLCDERQKSVIDTVCCVDWKSCDDDSDYIYKRESLATLSGKKLHRKRNHINNFLNIYDNVSYRPLTPENAADALAVAEQWLEEREEVNEDERSEFCGIKLALENIKELGIFGGLLYVDGVPAAMTAATAVSGNVTDVHYEKAVGEYAENGAYAVINRCFAASDESVGEYFNREEDMGIEGLRTAKESYFPAFKLKKFYGVIKC